MSQEGWRTWGYNSDYVLMTPKPISVRQTSFPGSNGEPVCTSDSECLKLNYCLPSLLHEF